MNLMVIGLLSYGISAVWSLIALIVLVVLIRLYTQTGMSGFLWLLFAVVVWPFIARGTSLLLPMYFARQAVPSTSVVMTTVITSTVEGILGIIFLLVAVLVLQRQITRRAIFAQSVPGGAPTAPAFPYRG